MLDEAVLWTMLTRPRAEGGCSSPLSIPPRPWPGYATAQIDKNGAEKVISYASKDLKKPEYQYCVTRKDLLAVGTFVEHFQPYLLGRRFTLQTDHDSLTWLSQPVPEGQSV